MLYSDRMDAISYSEARAKLATVMDMVCENHDPILITRQGRPTAVLISLEDYESLDATAYLRRTPASIENLNESIAQFEAGNVITFTMEELEAMAP
jgi:antitoxin YefM